jgi:hypothetical protein
MNDLDTALAAIGETLRTRGAAIANTDHGWQDLLQRVGTETDSPMAVRGDTTSLDRSPFAQRRWLTAAAAILLIVGILAAFVVVTGDHASEPVSTPTGPLFLLPTQGSGYEVADGALTPNPFGDATGRSLPAATVLLGVRDGSAYTRLVSITVRQGAGPDSEVMSMFERRDVQTSTGPAIVLTQRDDIFRMVVQERDDHWIEVTPGADVSDETAITALEATTIVDGQPRLADPPGELVEIARAEFEHLNTTPLVSFQVSGNGITPDDKDGSATVDAVDWPSDLVFLGPSVATRIEPITIAGTTGWLKSGPGEGGLAVVWRALSGHLIGVSGHEPLDTLVDLAESLQPVDESAWRIATGAADTPASTTTAP